MAAPSILNFGKRAMKVGGVVHDKFPLNGLQVINKTGSDIAINKLVAVVGFDTTANRPKVVLADANTATHTNVYVTLTAITNNAEGIVWKGGQSTPVLNTNSATTVGDPVYLSETAGSFAHTAPSGNASKVIPVGWVTVKSATVGVIDWYIGPEEKADWNVTEVVAATNAIAATESGSTFFLNSATEFVSTLPAPAAGLRFTFVVTAAPSGASYTIVTTSSSNIIKGQVYTLDVNSATDPDFETSGGDTISFVDAKAVAGDRVDVICDGTNWFAYGFCSVFDAITITTAS